MSKNIMLRHICHIAKHGECSDKIDVQCDECPLDQECLARTYFPDMALKGAANQILADMMIDRILTIRSKYEKEEGNG